MISVEESLSFGYKFGTWQILEAKIRLTQMVIFLSHMEVWVENNEGLSKSFPKLTALERGNWLWQDILIDFVMSSSKITLVDFMKKSIL